MGFLRGGESNPKGELDFGSRREIVERFSSNCIGNVWDHILSWKQKLSDAIEFVRARDSQVITSCIASVVRHSQAVRL